ncbi:hypothetical protein [Planococcus wigleyi]|uniref:Uncharacterized protein n=1 Tax=Planococcus wigleyi TaxID=2762216 RepID=A0ABR8WED7_9BACL|nr:hypothetical protein [Planococcus wigleyi]MBD8015051.1 hypothetical protein [Planococcus wigleyi]
MGYELMGTTEKACPCGKSLIIESRYMDDWNRTKSDYEMVCETCRSEYTHQEGQWVKLVDWQKKAVAVQRYNTKRLSVEKLAAEELADEWYQHFAHIKTKKGFYNAMAEDTGAGLTISRFNKEVAGKSMEETIKLLFGEMLRSWGPEVVAEKISSKNEKIIAESESLKKLFAEKRAAEIEWYKMLRR